MIIGLTGAFSSGKDAVAKYLMKKGFSHVSTGDILRKEANRRKLRRTREYLQMLGNEFRKKHGSGYLAKLALKKFPDSVVVSGIRNTGEIEELKKAAKTGFLMLAIDAPILRRYQWAEKRGKLTDGVTLKEFRLQEEFERGGSRTGLQLGKVMAKQMWVLRTWGHEWIFIGKSMRS